MSWYQDQAAMLQLAHDIAEHLKDFTVELYPVPFDGHSKISLVNGAFRLVLHQDSAMHRKGKVTFLTDLPYGDRVNDRTVTSPDLTLSAHRTGKSLAGDITRRLLPEYVQAMRQAREQIDAARSRRAETKNMAQAIAAMLPDGYARNSDDNGTNQRITWRGSKGQIDLWSGRSAVVSLNVESPEFLTELVELIAKHSA
ncbi:MULTISPECIES: hypothetical protein [Streptosporangium]|uniref:ESX secretion-associated protein EspG n=1 Tax=Streptosporangium brasiliense TaxID=47480 RepID=A0ABT9RM81_9ACTN|nr:hypothetical protein [Streptosporangium brasiliense]MDP9870387.1 hypothetical protein [Streptosporangium brasiliense]